MIQTQDKISLDSKLKDGIRNTWHKIKNPVKVGAGTLLVLYATGKFLADPLYSQPQKESKATHQEEDLISKIDKNLQDMQWYFNFEMRIRIDQYEDPEGTKKKLITYYKTHIDLAIEKANSSYELLGKYFIEKGEDKEKAKKYFKFILNYGYKQAKQFGEEGIKLSGDNPELMEFFTGKLEMVEEAQKTVKEKFYELTGIEDYKPIKK